MAKLQRRRLQPPPDIVRTTEVRIARGDVEIETRSTIDPATGRMTGRSKGDVVRSRLWRMHRNGDLSPEALAVGERFALLVERTEVSVRSCLDREIRGSAPDAPIQSRAAQRRADAMSELDWAEQAVGPVLLPVLYCVAVDGRPAAEWAQSVGKPARHGTAALCLALDALVRHWRDR